MRYFEQIYKDGNVLSSVGGVEAGKFIVESVQPRGLCASVRIAEAGAVRRFSLFSGGTIFGVLFSLVREEFERLMGYDAGERTREFINA